MNMTHLEKINTALAELRKDVTEQDRKDAMGFVKVKYTTISNYLNKKGNNIDTAYALLTFFQKRISEREKAIPQLN